MLYLLPLQWLHTRSYYTIKCFLSYDDPESLNHRHTIIFGDCPNGKLPYEFGNKPLASRKDYLGNRSVNHLSYHGQLFDDGGLFLWDPHPRVDDRTYGRYTLAGIVTDIYGYMFSFGTEYHCNTIYSDPTRVVERTLIKLVRPVWGHEGWLIASYTMYRDITWHNATTREEHNLHLGNWTYIATRRNGTPSFTGVGWSANVSQAWFFVDPETSESVLDSFVWEFAYQHLIDWIKATKRWGNVINRPQVSEIYNSNYGYQSSFLSKLKTSLYTRSVQYEPNPNLDRLGDATQRAADRCRYFDGNTAVYIKELFELKDSILSLYQLLQGEVNLKSLSDLWVSSQYGLKLTALDTLDLGEALYRKVTEGRGDLFSVSRGAVHDDTFVYNCKLYYDPATRSGFQKANATLMEWDLFPSLQNVWDIVPYSFVVDWFIDVEGFLEAIDTRTYLSVLNIFRVLYSYRYQWEIPDFSLGTVKGAFSATRFVRFSANEAVEPKPTFSGSLPDFKKLVTGTALIIQRK